MHTRISHKVVEQAETSVANAAGENGIVNVSEVSERLRVANLRENIALEDIERLVLSIATSRGAILVFDRASLSTNVMSPMQTDELRLS